MESSEILVTIWSDSLKDKKSSREMCNGAEELELSTMVSQSGKEAASSECPLEGIKMEASDKTAAVPAWPRNPCNWQRASCTAEASHKS